MRIKTKAESAFVDSFQPDAVERQKPRSRDCELLRRWEMRGGRREREKWQFQIPERQFKRMLFDIQSDRTLCGRKRVMRLDATAFSGELSLWTGRSVLLRAARLLTASYGGWFFRFGPATNCLLFSLDRATARFHRRNNRSGRNSENCDCNDQSFEAIHRACIVRQC
jgi:hypothetical protein